MIIGISGKIGSGKDTVGSIIQWLQLCRDYPVIWGPEYNQEACAGLGTFENFISTGHTWRSDWHIKKFAMKMKQCVGIITGISLGELEDINIKNSLIGSDWGDLTYRRLLQLLGTEVGRSIHENFWVNALFVKYIAHDKEIESKWIITDMRFPNELKAVKDRGGITIRLTRNTEVDAAIASHTSETALDDATFDHVVENNSTIEELIEKIKYLNLLG
jgi:hypothetical protein